ncbi:hypothetical protein F183_A29500 [Bryobacterales bacterium F-183]|nr:hypothetical protein F183_A29500 [Bryobacterales bacterium F-183]
MTIGSTLDPGQRSAWRAWLAANHATESEIWLLLRPKLEGHITYLDAVEEAICFGWIDGITKTYQGASAVRFTPRRPRSNWTELNKERARRLIAENKMTEAGARNLPDLSETTVRVPADIEQKLREAGAWQNFLAFPPLYARVRIGYIEEFRNRKPSGEWEKRLQNFIRQTAQNKMFGNWDDSGLPRTES